MLLYDFGFFSRKAAKKSQSRNSPLRLLYSPLGPLRETLRLRVFVVQSYICNSKL